MLRASICLGLGAFVFASGVFCQTYVGIIASANGSIAVQTFPNSINKQGEIAGDWEDSSFKIHGFVRDPGGTITSFDWPGSDSSGAHSTVVASINDAGAITGSSISGLGFVRDPEGYATSFNAPGSIATSPQASMLEARSPAFTKNAILYSTDSFVNPMERSRPSTRRAAL